MYFVATKKNDNWGRQPIKLLLRAKAVTSQDVENQWHSLLNIKDKKRGKNREPWKHFRCSRDQTLEKSTADYWLPKITRKKLRWNTFHAEWRCQESITWFSINFVTSAHSLVFSPGACLLAQWRWSLRCRHHCSSPLPCRKSSEVGRAPARHSAYRNEAQRNETGWALPKIFALIYNPARAAAFWSRTVLVCACVFHTRVLIGEQVYKRLTNDFARVVTSQCKASCFWENLHCSTQCLLRAWRHTVGFVQDNHLLATVWQRHLVLSEHLNLVTNHVDASEITHFNCVT